MFPPFSNAALRLPQSGSGTLAEQRHGGLLEFGFTVSAREIVMTGVLLLGGPLLVIVGCLFWVLSLANEQAKVNAEIWKRHGVDQ